MRNPNVRILLIAALLIAAVAAAGILTSRPMAGAPQAGEEAQAYLRVQVGSEVWPLMPLQDGGEHVVEQANGRRNVIHTTETGAVMHFSTCDNQNCVQQGEASLENRDGRVLGGLIICLPNEIVLEVLSAQEAQAQEEMK